MAKRAEQTQKADIVNDFRWRTLKNVRLSFLSLISSNNPTFFHCYAKFVDTLLILIKVVVNSSSFQLGFKN
jgi:hypothetical protein